MVKVRDEVLSTPTKPYLLSVGQVCFEETGKIALMRKDDGRVTIPSECPEEGECVDDTLKRGAEEEIGILVEKVLFVGSLIETFRWKNGNPCEKTTVYYVTKKTGTSSRKPESYEEQDKVLWIVPAEAIRLLEDGGNPESGIVKRVMELMV